MDRSGASQAFYIVKNLHFSVTTISVCHLNILAASAQPQISADPFLKPKSDFFDYL